MAQDPKQRQKALERKAAKERQRKAIIKKQALTTRLASNPKTLIQASPSWPVHEVLISRNWDREMELCQVFVSRQSTQDQFVVGVFLVDLACLGVKNAIIHLFHGEGDYSEFKAEIYSEDPFVRTHLNHAAKIVREGIRYASGLGFDPHPDYFTARVVLTDADPDACSILIPVGGPDGKPCYIDGPYDNVRQIMRHLTRRLGPEGFNYMISIAEPIAGLEGLPGQMIGTGGDSDEDWDDEEEE